MRLQLNERAVMRLARNWKRRLSIMVAPLIAATATVATSQDQAGAANSNPDDDNDTVRAANGESTFELCSPDFGNGKFGALSTFTIEGIDGQSITDTTGLTFEMTNGATTIDVTEFVIPVEEALNIDEQNFLLELLDVPLSTYVEPIKAPGLMGMSCGSGTVTYDENNGSNFDSQPFPSGTTLTAKRNGVAIATADMSGRGDQINEGPFVDLLQSIEFNSQNCSIVAGSVGAANGLLECSVFTDVYGTLVNATGRRLHPSLAYVATLIPAIFAYGCFYELNCEENGGDWFIPFIPGFFFFSSTSDSKVPALSAVASAMSQLKEGSVTLQAIDEPVEINVPDPLSDFCYASRIMALLPIVEPSENEPPVFHVTSIGRGMADALSDPNVNTWPEIDACLVNFDGSDGFTTVNEYIGFISLIITLELYLLQLYMYDMPMGLISSSLMVGTQSAPVRLNSLTRIPFAWEDGTLAPARVGRNYSDLVKANGTPVATYAVTSGALPRGLKLDSTTGAITGKARRQGTFTFTITAANSAGSMSQQFTMSVKRIRPRVTAKREGSLVSFTGRVSPELRKKKVELQVFKYGAWRTVSQLDIKKNGTFTTSTITKWTQRYRVAAGSTRSAVVTK